VCSADSYSAVTPGLIAIPWSLIIRAVEVEALVNSSAERYDLFSQLAD